MTVKNELHVPSINECIAMFGLDDEADILDEAHFGIVNGHLTTNVLKSKVLSFRTLFAPPFASSDLMLDGRIFGEAVKAKKYTWTPCEVHREGAINGIAVSSSLTLIEGLRALVLSMDLRNTTNQTVRVPLRFEITGGMDYVTDWVFVRPTANKPTRTMDLGEVLVRRNDTGEIALGSNIGKMTWEDFATQWSGETSVAAGESRSVHLVVGIGEKESTEKTVRRLLKDPAGAVEQSRQAWNRRAGALLERLPRFAASDKRLEQFYYRSILHFLLNRWEVPEFVLHPFYSTGSVTGGCVCSYLWDFGEGWEMFPLADPDAMREHIKAFLRTDLTRHFSFTPMSGAGWGPWYMINQEKIVFLIYYYVQFTGDSRFLHELLEGKPIIQWVVEQAMFGDRLEKDANLIDYGGGNHHLELRREYRYDHYMPDLNLRRYPIYLAAQTLCKMADHPAPVDFHERAEKLKKLVRQKLWSDKDKWWYFLDFKGNPHLRYTMQMFKVIGSGSISPDEERALVGHINEAEFLSEFGMHSMGKQDPAYDQVDIDNGGGGAYTSFPPQIIEKLYKAGYPQPAEDIFRRILWWGDRLPYWGDSLVANIMDYRKDTPLQSTVGSVAGAQAIIFGMFGVQVLPDGGLLINPAPPAFSPAIALQGLRLRGSTIDIRVDDAGYEVTINGRSISKKPGEAMALPAGEWVAGPTGV